MVNARSMLKKKGDSAFLNAALVTKEFVFSVKIFCGAEVS